MMSRSLLSAFRTQSMFSLSSSLSRAYPSTSCSWKYLSYSGSGLSLNRFRLDFMGSMLTFLFSRTLLSCPPYTRSSL